MDCLCAFFQYFQYSLWPTHLLSSLEYSLTGALPPFHSPLNPCRMYFSLLFFSLTSHLVSTCISIIHSSNFSSKILHLSIIPAKFEKVRMPLSRRRARSTREMIFHHYLRAGKKAKKQKVCLEEKREIGIDKRNRERNLGGGERERNYTLF